MLLSLVKPRSKNTSENVHVLRSRLKSLFRFVVYSTKLAFKCQPQVENKTNGAYLLTDLQLSCKDFRNVFDQLLAERKMITIRHKRRKYGIK